MAKIIDEEMKVGLKRSIGDIIEINHTLLGTFRMIASYAVFVYGLIYLMGIGYCRGTMLNYGHGLDSFGDFQFPEIIRGGMIALLAAFIFSYILVFAFGLLLYSGPRIGKGLVKQLTAKHPMMRLGVATFIAVIYFGVATIVGHYFGRHVVVVEQAHILGSSNTHKGDFILSNDANYYVLKDDRSDTVYYVPHSNVQSIKARSVHSRMLGND